MFDLFGTNQGKDPFKLGKQVSGRRTPRDQKKQNKNTMAVQTAGIFLPTSMSHFPLCVSIKKIQACKFFSLYWRNTSCLVSLVNDKISLICGYLEFYVIYVLFVSVCVSARNLLFWTHLFSSLLLLLLHTPALRGKWDSNGTGLTKENGNKSNRLLCWCGYLLVHHFKPLCGLE